MKIYRPTLYALVMMLACKAPQPGDGQADAQQADAPAAHNDSQTADAPPPTAHLTITSSRSVFDLHATETRDTKLTITNDGGHASGPVTVAATGLTLGTIAFASSSCTAGLPPYASCTVDAHFVAAAAGYVAFQITATASPGGTATANLSVTVRAACVATCGANTTTDCCASQEIPGNAPGATLGGATFYRSYDVGTDHVFSGMFYPAAVSDFRLDTYEVTVGRFRAFVNAGMGTQSTAPAANDGAHSAIPASGWDQSWNSHLATDTATLVANIKCDPTYQTWTDAAGTHENRPMNCVTWWEAMAFCAWDGGYLPTETEWNYAAAGGSEQRPYPWSASQLTINCTYANYVSSNSCGVVDTSNVGSKSPNGDGKWGQSDLGGNVAEWTLDWHGDFYANPCTDCADLTPVYVNDERAYRGGSFNEAGPYMRTPYRFHTQPYTRANHLGFRCSRAP